MNRWLKLAVLSLAAVCAYELFAWRARAVRSQAAAAVEAAPAFTLPASTGGDLSLASLRGKVVAVNFWATWCGPCREEIPDLAKVYAARKGGCFELLGIAEESGAHGEVMDTARKLGITYPVLFDDEAKVGDAFRIPAYPRTFLIDVEGRVRKLFEGTVDAAALDAALAPLLSECQKLSGRRG